MNIIFVIIKSFLITNFRISIKVSQQSVKVVIKYVIRKQYLYIIVRIYCKYKYK